MRPPRLPASPNARTRLPALLLVATVGCVAMGGREGEPLVPTKFETRVGPYKVYTSTPIPADDPAVVGLQALQTQMEATLRLRVDPASDPVEVYILADRNQFAHFLKIYYPELPPRRAFFLAQGSRRVVYTFRGDRLEEDLRHEAAHAWLNLAVGDLPLWLDEGLAEYFEGPSDRQGLNTEHLARLPTDRAEGWRPDLGHLETLTSVRDMTPRDYRESWLWVHYLLNGSTAGHATLLGYLESQRDPTDRRPLSERLRPVPLGDPRRVLAHLDRAADAPVALAPPARDPMIRLQDAAVEAPRKRGFFGRLKGFFGLGD